jgi:hypothetical protein
MPQAVNNLKYQQWDTCDRCGFFFPMSQLVKQKGLLICTRRTCFDNLTVERIPWVIEQVLGPTPEVEGADMRVIDRGFFEDFDQVQR